MAQNPRVNAELLNKLHLKAREWDAMCDVWVEQGRAIDPDGITSETEAILRKNLHKEAAEQIERLAEDYEMINSIMSSFFNLAKKLEVEIEPVLMDGIRGYLRTSTNGGMDQELADSVEAVLADYIRLYASKDLIPVLRGIAEAEKDQLKDSQSLGS